VIAVGDRLIIYDERKGNMGILEATPEAFQLSTEFSVEHGNGPHWSHPSVYEGKLYLRHGKSLLVYAL
jgi:hypothetical protein